MTKRILKILDFVEIFRNIGKLKARILWTLIFRNFVKLVGQIKNYDFLFININFVELFLDLYIYIFV